MKKNNEPKLHIIGADPREPKDEQKEKTLWELYNISQEEFAKLVKEGHQEFVEIVEKSDDEATVARDVLRYLADSNRSEASRAAIVLVFINNSNELHETKHLLGRLMSPVIGDAIGPALNQIAGEIGNIKNFINNAKSVDK